MARRKALGALEVECPLILYEAPHRIVETVQDLLAHRTLGARDAVAVDDRGEDGCRGFMPGRLNEDRWGREGRRSSGRR